MFILIHEDEVEFYETKKELEEELQGLAKVSVRATGKADTQDVPDYDTEFMIISGDILNTKITVCEKGTNVQKQIQKT